MEALADANAKLRRTQEKLATDNNGKTKWKKNTVSSLLLQTSLLIEALPFHTVARQVNEKGSADEDSYDSFTEAHGRICERNQWTISDE